MTSSATLHRSDSYLKVQGGQRCQKLDIHPGQTMCPWQLTFVGLLVLGASSLQSTSQRTHSTDQSFAQLRNNLPVLQLGSIACFHTCHKMQDFGNPLASLLSVLYKVWALGQVLKWLTVLLKRVAQPTTNVSGFWE